MRKADSQLAVMMCPQHAITSSDRTEGDEAEGLIFIVVQ